MIDPPALMLENKAAVTAMMIAQRASAPVFARGQSDFPIPMGKALPPLKFDHTGKPEVISQFADTPRHDADIGVRQATERRLVEMIEMGMGQQHQIDRGQVLDFQTGTLDSLQKEEPIGKVWIDQHVEIGKLE